MSSGDATASLGGGGDPGGMVGGYTTAMAALTGIAVLALLLLIVGVPETANRSSSPPGRSVEPPADPGPEPVSA